MGTSLDNLISISSVKIALPSRALKIDAEKKLEEICDEDEEFDRISIPTNEDTSITSEIIRTLLDDALSISLNIKCKKKLICCNLFDNYKSIHHTNEDNLFTLNENLICKPFFNYFTVPIYNYVNNNWKSIENMVKKDFTHQFLFAKSFKSLDSLDMKLHKKKNIKLFTTYEVENRIHNKINSFFSFNTFKDSSFYITNKKKCNTYSLNNELRSSIYFSNQSNLDQKCTFDSSLYHFEKQITLPSRVSKFEAQKKLKKICEDDCMNEDLILTNEQCGTSYFMSTSSQISHESMKVALPSRVSKIESLKKLQIICNEDDILDKCSTLINNDHCITSNYTEGTSLDNLNSISPFSASVEEIIPNEYINSNSCKMISNRCKSGYIDNTSISKNLHLFTKINTSSEVIIPFIDNKLLDENKCKQIINEDFIENIKMNYELENEENSSPYELNTFQDSNIKDNLYFSFVLDSSSKENFLSKLPNPINLNLLKYKYSTYNSFKIIEINGKLYVRMEQIGKGGSSNVYKGICNDGSECAIKCVNLKDLDNISYQNYKNEIKLLQHLKGNFRIIQLFDSYYCQDKKKLYLIMELGEGDLSIYLKKMNSKKNLNSANIIKKLWREMLLAVDVLHEEGIIHSDLKPENFVFVKGNLKLIDFGISKKVLPNATSVKCNQILGTFNYMSPEALSMNVYDEEKKDQCSKITIKSDIWSLGCILYLMVYGNTPFNCLTNVFQKIKAINDDNYSISFPQTDISNVINVLQNCLKRDPKKRPSIKDLFMHSFNS